jgi:predicted  nucleic acid-binding Zn-ribbon protein
LRKVREIFSQIRLQYRRNQQNIEAIKRQLEANPGAFKELQKQDVRASQSIEERVSQKSVAEVKSEIGESEKRAPIDK